jgi:hypothetical protein
MAGLSIALGATMPMKPPLSMAASLALPDAARP